MSEGPSRLCAENETREAWLARLDAVIELGLAQADRGETVAGDEARRTLQARIATRRKAF
jgi:predicted transcriptional regulator